MSRNRRAPRHGRVLRFQDSNVLSPALCAPHEISWRIVCATPDDFNPDRFEIISRRSARAGNFLLQCGCRGNGAPDTTKPPCGGLSERMSCFHKTRGCQKFWSGRRDSNPRPRPWQGRALPLSYTRILDFLWAASAPPTRRPMPKAADDCNTSRDIFAQSF